MTDVIIVSAFGRGHWMAWELAEKGLSVQLLDFSESLGRWTPEDWEGPFGVTKTDWLTASQWARLQEEDDLDEVHGGWTFWVPDGPLDTRGPFSQHFFSGPLSGTAKAPFDQAWPHLMANSLSSTDFLDHAQARDVDSGLDIFSPFFVHRVSRRGFQNSLDWCRKRGVEVFESAYLEDIQIETGYMRGVEVRSTYKGALRSERFIWCLTSAETDKLQSKVANTLYPSGVLESEWSWIRYRVSFDEGLYQQVIPVHAVVLDDLYLPWSHANLLILQKTVKPQHYDVWMRLPTHHRFQRAYLEEAAKKAEAVLQKKLPFSKIQTLEMPQDYLYDFAELGPSLFPVFNRERRMRHQPKALRNVAYDGPESWSSLDWLGRFRHQSAIVEKMAQWKTKMLEQELRKKGSRDRSIHSP